MSKRKFLSSVLNNEPADLQHGQVGSIEPAEPGQIAITPALVREQAMALLPPGGDRAIEALRSMGIDIPDPQIIDGQALNQLVDLDLAMLNLLLGKAIGMMRYNTALAEALRKADTILADRLATQLEIDRQRGQQHQFNRAMAAVLGGDPSFRFQPASSYELPIGWESFGTEQRPQIVSAQDSEQVESVEPIVAVEASATEDPESAVESRDLDAV